MDNQENQEETTITISSATYTGLNLYRGRESRKKGERQDWDQFFDQLMKGRERNDRLIDWAYTFGIFFVVTTVLIFPLLLVLPAQAILLYPSMVLVGLIFALFSAYIVTPFGLRHFRPYREDPQVQQYLERLAAQAEIKTPRLLVAETPEINALAFTSLFGGRVCLTRGILDLYQSGEISDEELKAIIGHEIGHIKHGDCLKWSFVLSWLSIFDIIGTLLLVMGGAFAATGVVTSVLSDRDNSGPLLAILGIAMVIAGVIQRLVGKVASLPALHLSRRHEFAADLTGAQLTSPDAQISVLQKIEKFNNRLIAQQLAQLPLADRWQAAPRNMSWIDGLFSTHPPIEKRVGEIQQVYDLGLPGQGLPQPRAPKVVIPGPTPAATKPATRVAPGTSTAMPTPIDSADHGGYTDLFEQSIPGPDPDTAPEPGQGKKFRKERIVPIAIVVCVLIAGSLLLVPSLMQMGGISPVSAGIPGGSPVPSITAQSPTPTTPVPTSTPPTQVAYVMTPASLGQSATVTLPHHENLELKYNTVNRYISTSHGTTIRYTVVANQITEVKELGEKSGYATKVVTYNDPGSYLIITVKDARTGEVIAMDGFGRKYSSSPEQKIVVRQAGNLNIEITGARVSVDLSVS